MPNWKDEYLASIRAAEQDQPINYDLVDTCSQLVDRVAALEAEKAKLQCLPPTPSSAPAATASKKAVKKPNPTATKDDASANPSDPALTTQLRLELAEALRASNQFSTRLRTAEDELSMVRARSTTESARLQELEKERKLLLRKLRDREDELKEKDKLVENVQDELQVLHLQLDIVEARRAEKERENKQLVERYKKRVEKEADDMNKAMNFEEDEADLDTGQRRKIRADRAKKQGRNGSSFETQPPQ